MAVKKKKTFSTRWKKSETFKLLRLKEKEIKNNPKFKKERKALEANFPPFLDKRFEKWSKETLSYPEEWEKFCAEWKIDRDAFLFHKRRVKVNPPISIKGSFLPSDKFKLRMEIDESKSPVSFTGQEYRDFGPLLMRAKDDLIGKAKSRAGRKNVKKRNIKIRREYKRLCKEMTPRKAKEKLAGEIYEGIKLSFDSIANLVSKK